MYARQPASRFLPKPYVSNVVELDRRDAFDEQPEPARDLVDHRAPISRGAEPDGNQVSVHGYLTPRLMKEQGLGPPPTRIERPPAQVLEHQLEDSAVGQRDVEL